MVTVGICGAGGRMGRALLELLSVTEGMKLGAAIERADSPLLGQDAGVMAGIGPQGVNITAAVAAAEYDVLIDFTCADAVVGNLQHCLAQRKPVVIGATGLSATQQAQLREAGRELGIVLAPNMSMGVNLCFQLARLAAESIGADSDIEIIEAHHNRKVDAPSGTAVRLGEVVAAALGRELADCAVYGRQGHTGARQRQTIGFETIRAGDIVGEHTLMFASAGERVEIRHVATSRKTFAAGALRAARWIQQQPPGLYDMQDVLGLR